jgi:hypothetical protein
MCYNVYVRRREKEKKNKNKKSFKKLLTNPKKCDIIRM